MIYGTDQRWRSGMLGRCVNAVTMPQSATVYAVLLFCLFTHTWACGKYEKRCLNGQCIRKTEECPKDLCQYGSERCDDGNCYMAEEKCNGVAICPDLSDEKDCDDDDDDNHTRNSISSSESLKAIDILNTISKWPVWVYIIIGVIIFLLGLIIALCCRYQKKQARRERLRREGLTRRRLQELQQQAPANQPTYSQEMPNIASRRQQLVPGSYQPVPTQPPRSGNRNQQAQHSAPSPFNPAFTTQSSSFPQCNTAFPQANSPYLSEGGLPHGGASSPEPSAPPGTMEAPPPYSEAVGDPYPPPQPGCRGPDYLPSYATVQRMGPQ